MKKNVMDEDFLLNQIDKKEMELSQLKHNYDVVIKTEKGKVLQNKNGDLMAKTKYLLGFKFESSSCQTPQYLEFHRVFKKEFSELMKPVISEIKFSKPNHFDVAGFFKTKKGKVFYFSLSDLRWNKDSLMFRTAKDFDDFTGGSNYKIPMNEIEKIKEAVK